MINQILIGDVLEKIKEIPDQYINTVVTSPPYWGLRDYGVDGQIGLEETLEEYIEKIVSVFREVRRVLRDDGTLWLNLGDSYAGSGQVSQKQKPLDRVYATISGTLSGEQRRIGSVNGLKPKDLVGIPWMVAFALRADGWYLRQDIIWSKPNPMPESVRDRCTKSHEDIFLLSKSRKYYYDADAIREPVTESSIKRLSQNIENQIGSYRFPGKTNGSMKAVSKSVRIPGQTPNTIALKRMVGEKDPEYITRNKRSVWTVSTKPFPGAHFATFPPDLIEPCILAGCPREGIVLDPFFGSGTVGIVALKNARHYIGIELNPEYTEMARNRIEYGTVDKEKIINEKLQGRLFNE